MFRGSYTALITPFRDDKFDEVAFANIVKRQIKGGTKGLVPVGTTGESPTLSHEEHNEVIRLCVELSGDCKVVAGSGSNSTREAILRTQYAQSVGADCALVMTPYYNKPTQEGIYRHFEAIHNNSDIPIMIYNIPGRCVVDITDETIRRIADELPRVKAIKDATGDLSRPTSLAIGDGFDMLSGEDATAVEFNRLGGVGCISVTSNIVPELCAEMQNLCLAGKFDEADILQRKMDNLNDAMFCETNPIPVKYAASLLGLCSDEIRLPLCEPSDNAKAKIRNAMAELDLIS